MLRDLVLYDKKTQIARRIGVLLDWQMTAPKQVELTIIPFKGMIGM